MPIEVNNKRNLLERKINDFNEFFSSIFSQRFLSHLFAILIFLKNFNWIYIKQTTKRKNISVRLNRNFSSIHSPFGRYKLCAFDGAHSLNFHHNRNTSISHTNENN